MRALLVLLLLTSIARADFSVERVMAPANAVTTTDVTDALEALDVNCRVKDTMLVWIVFQGGKVASIDAGGTADRKVERCIAAGLRKAKLASKQRAVAVVVVTALGIKLDPFSNPRPDVVPKPAPPANIR